jgi:hypothetical protein
LRLGFPGLTMGERRNAGRRKSFLRGLVYFDNKHGALCCLVRDLSDKGARIIFSESVTVPETFDLHILQKNQTLRAKVTWRRGDEIGLDFIAATATAAAKPDAEAKPDAVALADRVAELEGEVASLRKLLKRMKGGQQPVNNEAAA